MESECLSKQNFSFSWNCTFLHIFSFVPYWRVEYETGNLLLITFKIVFFVKSQERYFFNIPSGCMEIKDSVPALRVAASLACLWKCVCGGKCGWVIVKSKRTEVHGGSYLQICSVRVVCLSSVCRTLMLYLFTVCCYLVTIKASVN